MKRLSVLLGGLIAGAVLMAGVAPVAAGAPVQGDAAKGQKVYTDQKCNLCHKVGTTGGKLGPELTNVGSKRDRAWLAKYLPNPKALDPKNKMPVPKVKGEDLDNLIAYLLTLKGK
jgi:cytochrome c2